MKISYNEVILKRECGGGMPNKKRFKKQKKRKKIPKPNPCPPFCVTGDRLRQRFTRNL